MYFGKVISLFFFCFLLGGIWAQDVIPEIPEDVRPTEPTTTTTTDATRTSTTKSTTTTTTEPTTTTSTTKPITTSTTQRPPFEQPTRTTEIPGVWMQPLEICFLRNQMKYNTCKCDGNSAVIIKGTGPWVNHISSVYFSICRLASPAEGHLLSLLLLLRQPYHRM